jgi:transposase InsO family protein
VTNGEQAEEGSGGWLVEHRYRAVLRVLEGAPVAVAARQAGTSRQSLYAWLRRYEAEGMAGLADKSRRPHTSPNRLPAEMEAMVCDLRQQFPRWGARRISHELRERGVEGAPGRSTVYRVLVRNGLINHEEQRHKRKYRRWQRDAPMQLWQMDIMGGVFLEGGRECKLVTGIDDHSRFVVIAQVVAQPSGRAVCTAFTEALQRYGVPSEVLTDNGKQFTGRFTKPVPAEVLFERICRENGITARLTKPRSPTTTGKIERFHGSLRRELLDMVGAFADQATAQAVIDAWVHAYNHSRPHQSLKMATPVSVFRPSAVAAPNAAVPEPAPPAVLPPRIPAELVRPTATTAASELDVKAVEWQKVVPIGGRLTLPNNCGIKLGQAYAGRTVTIWADDRSVHVCLDGHLIRTRSSRLSATDLFELHLKGARLAGPEPGPSAMPALPPAPATVVEVDRTINSSGWFSLGGQRVRVASHLIGKQVTVRLDGYLMHVIAGGLLAQTLPAPVPPNKRATLAGARVSDQPLPPPPAQAPRAQRRVGASGEFAIAGQRVQLSRSHAGKTVTVIIEDTHLRVVHNDIELALVARKNPGQVARFKATVRPKN